MATLENDFLKITAQQKGAELTSIFNKQTQTEHLWQANPDIWPWHAPNLFPIVGGLQNDQLLLDGELLPMKRHGFARLSEFSLVDANDKHAKFSLPFSESTLKIYPYRFEFQVLYDLFERDLRVTYKVINQDAQTIYFSVGGHPAFNVPFFAAENYSDYYIEFDNSEPLLTHLLSPQGLYTGQRERVVMDGNKIWLNQNLFKQDALVFKNITSKTATIGSKNHDHQLRVAFGDFKDLGLWAKPGAPFVCIEPWLGYADAEGEQQDFKLKEGIEQVEHGHVFEAQFTISIS